jgi:hypothetical protein
MVEKTVFLMLTVTPVRRVYLPIGSSDLDLKQGLRVKFVRPRVNFQQIF